MQFEEDHRHTLPIARRGGKRFQGKETVTEINKCHSHGFGKGLVKNKHLSKKKESNFRVFDEKSFF